VARFARRGEAGRRVRRVGSSRVVLLVARVAQCAIERIVVVDMTVGTLAWRHGVRVGQREPCRRVVKLPIGPLNSVVAGLTSRREPGRSVRYRGGRIVVVGLVARNARRARQTVVIVDVAVGAGSWWYRVRTGQRETSAVVVEGCVHPVRGVVTAIASLREIRRYVIRIGRTLIVLEVAAHAGRSVEAVVVVNVTICASSRRYRVQTGQREARVVVVEGCVHPVRGVVTLVAGLREVRCHVIRISRALIVL